MTDGDEVWHGDTSPVARGEHRVEGDEKPDKEPAEYEEDGGNLLGNHAVFS